MERGGRIRGESVEKREREKEGEGVGWDRNGGGRVDKRRNGKE